MLKNSDLIFISQTQSGISFTVFKHHKLKKKHFELILIPLKVTF